MEMQGGRRKGDVARRGVKNPGEQTHVFILDVSIKMLPSPCYSEGNAAKQEEYMLAGGQKRHLQFSPQPGFA